MSERGFDKFRATIRNASGGLQLSREEAFENANAVYNWFGMLGAGRGANWDDMSIAAMLGNMYLESRLNPDAGAGYTPSPWNMNLQGGLVQWNPASKMATWAGNNGMWYPTIQPQCKRISYELENPLLQWVRAIPVSFEEFANGEYTPKTVDHATDIFASNYERNAGADLDIRQIYARYWYGQIPNFYELIWPPPWLLATLKRRFAAYE